MTNVTSFLPKAILLLVLSSVFFSCASRKDIVYFQDAGNFETIVSENSYANKFKVDDVVSIHVSTLDPEASVPFNLFKGAQEGGIRPEQVDYIIDKSGNIDFPVLGAIKIAGLTPEEVKEMLRQRLEDGYLKNPIINVRLKNFTVTILGEVNRPGTYPVDGEQITILEALGLANDLTIKGMRTNVKVIRDFNGTKVYNTIDLTSKKALDSPVYYLTQNDVVYVVPNKSAITSSSLDNRASIAVTIAAALITSTAIIITSNNR
ncbi:Polysaccharide export outer membrane protein [Croceitalea dokdonensis DOKDO 023]|uniref:Polysaccharide export outer membrane protein n=1 Tax=Croceitalea dokdonensis DOKDO 023 TaxID=1300341 RepID=A0A0N8H3C6_9FLAO|nr:polysaccharide biosynthesis/export family protein [Croceitalea dokdonensis]KPM30196.1 Polysaccharide export outer membrane protein [Croceitalea dokdonensis DOKDO 023]